MTSQQITVSQCAALSGLGSQEIVLGVTPSARHNSLRAAYLIHHERGWEGVRDMIVADIRVYVDLGASQKAADLLIVLRRLFEEGFGGTCVPCLNALARIVSLPSSAGVGFNRQLRVRE
jgi:hypothetical protein